VLPTWQQLHQQNVKCSRSVGVISQRLPETSGAWEACLGASGRNDVFSDPPGAITKPSRDSQSMERTPGTSVSNGSGLPGCRVGLYPTQSTRSRSKPALNPTWSYFPVPNSDLPRYPARFCRVSASFLIGQYYPIFYAPIKYLSSDCIAI
jgi:hypothetical protein